MSRRMTSQAALPPIVAAEEEDSHFDGRFFLSQIEESPASDLYF